MILRLWDPEVSTRDLQMKKGVKIGKRQEEDFLWRDPKHQVAQGKLSTCAKEVLECQCNNDKSHW